MVDPQTGFITPQWWYVFQRLIQRTGGQSGTSLYMPLTGGTFTGPVIHGANLLSGSDILFTGGSVDGTAIGGTSPDAGSFTSLSAAGTVSGAGFTSLLTPYAPLLSPDLTGIPTMPTASPGTNTTQGATTEFVQSAVTAATGVTEVDTGTGLTGGPITSTGTISLATIAADNLLANATGSTAAPVATTLTALIDAAIGSTQGDVLYRSGTAWTVLAPGSSGQFLSSGGASANPSWSSAGAFTTLSASGVVSGAGFSTYLASPPAIGGTAPAAGAFTTLSASGNDALTYQNTSALAIPTATVTIVTGWTKLFDRVGANFDATSGVFTAPANGYYQVSAGIGIGSAGNAVGQLVQVRIVANSVAVAIGAVTVQTATSESQFARACCVVYLASGQTLTVDAWHNMTGSPALLSTASYNWISINQVP